MVQRLRGTARGVFQPRDGITLPEPSNRSDAVEIVDLEAA
ncbi:hypothetical protein FrEUN1fDRAFT_4333 [Parafrankia sp. EUN1f]|nr:hypothetical protein FrEUN1fDRAFT_4333 [Parafrankia sp. EUN1f]